MEVTVAVSGCVEGVEERTEQLPESHAHHWELFVERGDG